MKYLKLMVLGICIVTSSPMLKGQSLQDIVDSFSQSFQNNNIIISDAITPALSIVRQQFRLEREGKSYGKNNMPFYGETFSLGVKVSGGEVLQNQVLCPWNFDADYIRINQSRKYKPVYFWSFQRAINDSVFNSVEMELETEYVRPIDGDSLIFMHTDAQSDFGLDIDETAGDKSGYLIWAYASNMHDSTMQVSFKQSPLQIVACKDSVILVKTKDPDRILGGLYVVPVIEKAGVIRVKLVGVCAKNNAKDWTLCLLTKDERQKTAKRKRPSKKSTEESEPTPIK